MVISAFVWAWQDFSWVEDERMTAAWNRFMWWFYSLRGVRSLEKPIKMHFLEWAVRVKP